MLISRQKMAAAVHLVTTLPHIIKDIHSMDTLTNDLNMKFLILILRNVIPVVRVKLIYVESSQ